MDELRWSLFTNLPLSCVLCTQSLILRPASGRGCCCPVHSCNGKTPRRDVVLNSRFQKSIAGSGLSPLVLLELSCRADGCPLLQETGAHPTPSCFLHCQVFDDIVYSPDGSVDVFLLSFFCFHAGDVSKASRRWSSNSGPQVLEVLMLSVSEELVWKSRRLIHDILLAYSSSFQPSEIKPTSEGFNCLALCEYILTNEPENSLSF